MSRGADRHLPLSPLAASLVAARFRILGEPIRIRILEELHEGERNVSDLVKAIASTQPNVSKHLRILQEAGVVARRQEGNNVFYSVTDGSVFTLCNAVCRSVGERLTRDAKLAGELRRR